MDPRASLIKQPWAWALIAFLIAGVVTISMWTRPASRSGGAAGVERPAAAELEAFGKVPPFSLTERSGKKVQASDLSGKVWIADFIYTNCTDTCPLQSAEMKTFQDRFASEPDLRLVSITVDPKRDTPAVLSGYAARYGADSARWLFLTGAEKSIYRLAEDGFHLPAAEIARETKAESSGATHLHSPRFALVDRTGEIRGYYVATEKEALARLGRDAGTLLRRAG
jgi:protein SCO1/2